MKNAFFLSTLAILVSIHAGCNDPTTQVKSDTNVESNGNNESTKIVDQIRSDEIDRNIANWVDEANQLESEFAFSDAVKVWKKVVSAVETQNGEQSWQATNARLSYETAVRQSQFNERELDLLRQFAEKQKETNKLLAGGKFFAAREQLDWMIDAVRQLYGNQSHGLGRLQLQVGQLLYQQGSHEESNKYLTAAYAINKARFGDFHPETETNIFLLGQSNLQLGNPAEGIQYLEQAEQVSKEIWGPEHLTTASRINDLGVAYQSTKQLEKAASQFSTAIDLRKKLLNPDHFAVGESTRNLGVAFLDQGKLEQASTHLRRAVEIFEHVNGSANYLTLDTRTQLATTNMLQKKYLSAESELRQVVHHFESDSPNSLPLAKASFQLAVALGYQGQYHEAEPLLERALGIQRSVLGQWHKDTVQTMRTLATLYERTRQPEKARTINEALSRLKKN